MASAGPIGLLGGTFDPVHAGHLRLANDAQVALGLSQLRLIPAGQPWQKGAITPAYHRAAMLERALGALADVPAGADWQVDLREVERAGPSYTVDTLREVRAAVGPAVPLVWILGFDQLCALPTWHDWTALAGLAHIAYAQRAGSPAELPGPLARYVEQRQGSAAALAGQACGSFVAFAMRPVDCSATQIRNALAAGDPVRAQACLSPEVLRYIKNHQLYLR